MTITIQGPRHVIAAVPSLVGFTPLASIVGIILSDTGTVLVTLRVDDDGDLDHACDSIDGVAKQLRADGQMPANLVLVTWGSRFDADDLGPLDSELIGGMEVRDILWVVGGEAGSYYCQASCCPFPVEVDVALAADMGRIPAASRDDLVASCAWDGVSDARRHSGASHTVSRGDMLAMLLALSTPDARTVNIRDAARLAAHCSTPGPDGRWDARDRVIVEFCRAFTPCAPGVIEAHARFLAAPEHAATLAVLGLFAYISGNGALARILLDRSGEGGDRPSLAALVETALDMGVSPATIAGMLVETDADLPSLV